MSGLNLTRERVTKVGKISEASLREDWLAMFDLLCGDDGVLDVIGNAIVDIQDLAHPSEGIKIDKKELIELGKKIRALIGGE